MWIKSSGALTENVNLLTTAVSTHVLIISDAVALVDAGISAIHAELEEQISKCLGDEGKIAFLLLTHAHFDHVGAIPYLRAHSPDMAVIAAPQTAELFQQESVIDLFYQKNLACAHAMKRDLVIEEQEWKAAMRVDRIIGDGDLIDLGDDIEIKLLSAAGHTDDSVAYFVKPDSVLACGESIGSYGGRDKVTSCFTSDYQDYLESLDKLSGLDVRILAFPHGGVLSGEMVPKFFMDAKRAAEQFRDGIKERIEQGELVEEIGGSILPEWQAQNISPEGPFVEEQENTLVEMIKAAASS